MTILTNFCGCCSLETGGVFLGFFGIVQSIIIIIICAVFLNRMESIHFFESYDEYVSLCLSLGLGISIVSLLISAMLIIGTVQKKYLLLLPWLFVNFICILIYGMGLFHVLFNFKLLGHAIPMFIFFGYNLYLWLAMYSLYKSIKQSPKYVSNNSQIIWSVNSNVNEFSPYVRQVDT